MQNPVATINFKSVEFNVTSFVNAKGKTRYNALRNGKVIFSFYQEDTKNTEQFAKEVTFEVREAVNRTSIFQSKDACREFSTLLIESIK